MTRWPRAPIVIAVAAFAVAIGRPPSDPDMFWHLASGKWMVEHRDLLRSDMFSWTIAGQPYSVGEWLGQIILYLAHAAAGWQGLVLLRGALVVVAAFFVARLVLRAQPRLLIAVPIIVAALALSTIVWTDRPNLFTLALFPLMLDLLLAARGGRTRLLVAIPPLLLVWTDLHGGYALGLGFVVLFAIDALVCRRAARAFAIAAVAAGAMTLLDPGGLGIAGAIAHVAAPPRSIVEETPPDILRPAGALFAAFLFGTLTVALRAGASPFDVLLLAPVLWLALSAQRNMPYFAFVAAPFLAARAPTALAPLRISYDMVLRDLDRGLLRGTVARAFGPAAAAAVTVALVLSLLTLPTGPDVRAYPSGAIGAIGRGDGLLNEYDWGGYLIWSAPQRPVFIDGRLFPYLPTVFADWNTMVRLGPGWRDLLKQYRVTSVLLHPDRPLAGALREDGWRVRAEGPGFVLLDRP